MMRLSIVFVFLPIVFSESNTNKCLADLGAVQNSCPTSFSIPGIHSNCCDAIRQMNRDGCFCNDAIEYLVNSGKKGGFAQLQLLRNTACIPLCLNWWDPCRGPARFDPLGCKKFRKSEYGCKQPDVIMDKQRLQSVIGLGTALTSPTVTADNKCFDLKVFQSSLEPFFDPLSSVVVGYGVGTYKGIVAAAEYLALALPVVNHKLWYLTTQSDANSQRMLYIDPSGKSIILGSKTNNVWFGKLVPGASPYVEQVARYDACSTKINRFEVLDKSQLPSTIIGPRVQGLNVLVQTFYEALTKSRDWSMENLCNTYMNYCVGPGLPSEWLTYSDCYNYMTSLPTISPKCGTGMALSGNSQFCRFKHQFMIPLDPIHCYHVGKGLPDIHGDIKCNDATECVDATQNVAYGDPSKLNLGVSTSGTSQSVIYSLNKTYAFTRTNVCPTAKTFNTKEVQEHLNLR